MGHILHYLINTQSRYIIVVCDLSPHDEWVIPHVVCFRFSREDSRALYASERYNYSVSTDSTSQDFSRWQLVLLFG